MRLFIALLFVVFMSSCKKDELKPLASSQEKLNSSTSSNFLGLEDNCEPKNKVVQNFLTGGNSDKKVWYLYYFDTQGNLASGLNGENGNSTYFTSEGRLLEYFGEDLFVIDTGTYEVVNCGTEIILNTNLSGPNKSFYLEKVTPNYLQGTFSIPVGPNGSYVEIRVKGYPTRKNFK